MVNVNAGSSNDPLVITDVAPAWGLSATRPVKQITPRKWVLSRMMISPALLSISPHPASDYAAIYADRRAGASNCAVSTACGPRCDRIGSPLQSRRGRRRNCQRSCRASCRSSAERRAPARGPGDIHERLIPTVPLPSPCRSLPDRRSPDSAPDAADRGRATNDPEIALRLRPQGLRVRRRTPSWRRSPRGGDAPAFLRPVRPAAFGSRLRVLSPQAGDTLFHGCACRGAGRIM